jgi:hypothetical protein
MRRFGSVSFVTLTAILLFTALWSACGGGSSSKSTTTNAIASFVFSPANISLEPGQVEQVSASALNSNGAVVSTTITYSSSDTANAAISPGGLLCGGAWHDTTYTVCDPGTVVGQATITATASDTAKTTGTATVHIHFHVDAVHVQAPSTTCTSSGKASTEKVQAVACTQASRVASGCTATSLCGPNMCDITTTVGTFNFGALDSTIATIGSDGTLTGGTPGITKIFAGVISGSTTTTSPAVPYTTCLVDSIKLHVTSQQDTNFTVAKAGTTALTADVVDSNGNSVTPTLTFNSLQGAVGAVSAGSPAVTGTFTAKAPGYGGVVASCTPPNCNKGAESVFSNVVTATVENSTTDTGVTANDTNIYVTGAGAVQMYPVDSTTFTLGTVMSLPFAPNSIAATRDGSKIFLGSATNAMVVATASNSVQTLSFGGKVLAVSPNSAYALIASGSTVYLMSGTSLTVANPGGFAIPNVKSASFTPDGNTVYFTDGANLYRYHIATESGSTPTPRAAAGADVITSTNGSIVFSNNGAKINADESCNTFNGSAYTSAFLNLGSQNFGAPSMLAQLPNGTGILAVDGTTLDTLSITAPNPLTSPFAGCPATGFATTPGTISLSSLGGSVNQVSVSNSGHYAAITTSGPNVGIVDLTNGTVTAVPLVNKGGGSITNSYQGDWMIDDSGFWVGASDSYIHLISPSTLQDTKQVQVQVQGPPSGGGVNFVPPSLLVVERK